MKDISKYLVSNLKGKRIFFTGSTGLLGKWLLEVLRETEATLVLLTRNPESFCRNFPAVNSMPVTFVSGDVRDFVFPEGYFDYCIHAATPVLSGNQWPSSSQLSSIIIDGTKRVLEFAESAGLQRLVYVSSGAVYGHQPSDSERLNETFPCNPFTPYGKGKLIAEELCLESKIDCIVGRCFAFVGPHMPYDAHFAIGNFIGNCLRGEPILIKGDGTAIRSYMYGSDLAEWLLIMLLSDLKNEIFNIGSDHAISIYDLAYFVRKTLSRKNPIVFARKKTNSIKNSSRYIPSIDKARGKLDLKLKVELKDSILKTVLINEANSGKLRF